jgi:hypothetical protein
VAAAAATLIGMLGALAFAALTGKQIADGITPTGMMLPDDIPGAIQWAAAATALVFLPLAEFWFVSYIGRLGAGLQSATAVSRHTRFIFLVGLTAAVALVALVLWLSAQVQVQPATPHAKPLGWFDLDQVRGFWRSVAAFREEQLAKLGEQRHAVENGLCVLAGLVIWFLYARLVGGGRRAIREWLEVNEPV